MRAFVHSNVDSDDKYPDIDSIVKTRVLSENPLMEIRVPYVVDDRGKFSLWEMGGAIENLGRAQIIADPDGDMPTTTKLVYPTHRGVRYNGRHALVNVNYNYHVVYAYVNNHNDVTGVVLYQIKDFYKERGLLHLVEIAFYRGGAPMIELSEHETELSENRIYQLIKDARTKAGIRYNIHAQYVDKYWLVDDEKISNIQDRNPRGSEFERSLDADRLAFMKSDDVDRMFPVDQIEVSKSLDDLLLTRMNKVTRVFSRGDFYTVATRIFENPNPDLVTFDFVLFGPRQIVPLERFRCRAFLEENLPRISSIFNGYHTVRELLEGRDIVPISNVSGALDENVRIKLLRTFSN